jgi:menaquinone-9 beta-reductase
MVFSIPLWCGVSESMKRWDAVVVGGGLAGSAAALRLAKHGRNVLLLEKEATARDKVCGEFISSEAQHYLREFGLDLTKLGSVPIANIRLIRGQKFASAKLPFCANDFIGFKMHIQLASAQKTALHGYVELTLFKGGYAGLEPVEGGKANLCLVVTKHHFAMFGKSWNGLLDAILKATPLLAERLAGSEPCWPRPLSIFGIPYGFVYRTSSEAVAGLYRLGDQMAVIPSFCGYGMSIALHTASLAVECYLHSDANTYHRNARSDLHPLIRRTSFLSKMANYPLAQQGMLLACQIRPELMTIIAAHNRIR